MRTHGRPLPQYPNARGILPSQTQSWRLGPRTTTLPRSFLRRQKILALGCTARSWRMILLWRSNAFAGKSSLPSRLVHLTGSCEIPATLFVLCHRLIACYHCFYIAVSKTFYGYEYPPSSHLLAHIIYLRFFSVSFSRHDTVATFLHHFMHRFPRY